MQFFDENYIARFDVFERSKFSAMELFRCLVCEAEPVLSRDDSVPAAMITCQCGTFRWAPSEDGDTREQSPYELGAEAVDLWNSVNVSPTS